MMTTAIAAMIAATMAHHLGLSDAVGKVLTKICGCPKCLSFWVSLSVLFLDGCDIMRAVLLSIAVSYASYWVGIILIAANDLYNRIWERLQRRRK